MRAGLSETNFLEDIAEFIEVAFLSCFGRKPSMGLMQRNTMQSPQARGSITLINGAFRQDRTLLASFVKY